jgi:hypothetical protein
VAWTTDDLIAAVRLRAQVPDEGEDSEPTDAEILRIAHEELISRFVGIIRSARENYLVTSEDIALVEDTQGYRIPRRAHANAVRDVWLVSPTGRTRALRLIDLTDGHYFGGDTGEPGGYYLSGAKIVLEPTPSSAMDGYSLRVFFYRAPSRLVLASECVAFVSHEGSGVFHISYSDLAAFTSDATWDLVQASPPFDLLADNSAVTADVESTAINITGVAGTTITIDPEAPTWEPVAGDTISKDGTDYTVVSWEEPLNEIVLSSTGITTGAATHLHVTATFASVDSASVTDGDPVCAHMTTCVPQIPDALWPALVSAVAVQVRLHEADPMGASAEAIQRDEYIKAALASMQPRVDGRAKSIVNLGSALRRRRPF